MLSSQPPPTPTALTPGRHSFFPIPCPSPSLHQLVQAHPCHHAHQSWAGCQSDRLTPQTGTARLGNCWVQWGVQNHLLPWD